MQYLIAVVGYVFVLVFSVLYEVGYFDERSVEIAAERSGIILLWCVPALLILLRIALRPGARVARVRNGPRRPTYYACVSFLWLGHVGLATSLFGVVNFIGGGSSVRDRNMREGAFTRFESTTNGASYFDGAEAAPTKSGLSIITERSFRNGQATKKSVSSR